MNEQIRELAKQAGGHKCLCIDSITLSLLGENSIEKFAELIVRECDRYARSAWEHGDLLGRDLLIHFGVEE
jgi:hypothetical protein